jgi:hypothetical protein
MKDGKVDDQGRKIYRLSRDAAMVYAGDVLAAQRAVSDIERFFQRRRSPKATQNASNSVGLLLRTAYQQEKASASRKERMKVGPLWVLVGVCRPDGTAEIVRFASPKFQPLYVSGVDAVGWPADVANYRRVLEDMQRQRWDSSSEGMELDPNPEHWHMDVVLGIRGSLESDSRSPTIGGLVQSVIVTKGDCTESGFKWVIPGGDPMKEKDWESLTSSLDDVHQYRLDRKSSQPVAESGLVHAHIAD